jgi:hypothetical protein
MHIEVRIAAVPTELARQECAHIQAIIMQEKSEAAAVALEEYLTGTATLVGPARPLQFVTIIQRAWTQVVIILMQHSTPTIFSPLSSL